MQTQPIKIIITDSGLGGLSVAAKLEKELRGLKLNNNIELIFFNALADRDSGYNRMNNEAEKINTLNAALNGMADRFDPEMIIIACNTLSVIYPKTKFADNCTLPVLEIIGTGVNIIYESLKSNEKSIAVILGTETTVNSHIHQTEIIKRGISKSRIINQPCKYLESEIQKDPSNHMVKNLIAEYIGQALEQIDISPEKIYFALCCTHYSYSKNIFEDVIANKTTSQFELINPNEALKIESVKQICETLKGNTSKGKTSAKVVSRFEMPVPELRTISELLQNCSPSFAHALLNYECDPKLFVYPAK